MSEQRQNATPLMGAVLDGSYRVERMLGEGGMGAVYHATQLRLDKPVAIKVMARELSAAPEALARFHREAVVTSNLGHPNIVQVFDFSTTPTGEPFLVMELLDGEDLERRLRREGRLASSTTLNIVKQVGAALMATHAKGIVHRDLKPGNVYLVAAAGAGDFVKVLDFGISKVRSATTKLTRTASIMGTPAYMSPEQAKGKVEDIDDKTDQWALACITWECLTGEAPFQGESPLSIMFQVVNEPPPPLLPKAPGLHPKVEDTLLRALSKSKGDRFPSIGEFVAALEEAVTGTAATVSQTLQLSKDMASAAGKPTQPTTLTRTAGELTDEIDPVRMNSRRWLWAAAAAAAVVLIGALILLGSNSAAKQAAAPIPPAAPAPVASPQPKPAPPPIPAVAPAPPAPAAEKVQSPEQPPRAQTAEDKEHVRALPPAEAQPPKARPQPRRRAAPRMIEDL